MGNDVRSDELGALLAKGRALCEGVWEHPERWNPNHSAAIALFERVLDRKPDHVPALINLGAALSNMGKHKAALKVLRKAEALGSSDRNLYVNLGVAMVNAGAWTRASARKQFLKAEGLVPDASTFEAYFDPHGT